jgi:abortive infection bacteriophage resistance protein
MRNPGGFHFVGGPVKPYDKAPLTFPRQVTLLQQRGMVIGDSSQAEAFLTRVNYYRFSAYVLPFEVRRHEIRPGTTFEQVQKLYELDGVLMNALLAALGEWEIAFRTRFTYALSHSYGPFCHLDPARFRRTFDHGGWLRRVDEEVERSRETFVEHYRNTYEGYPRLPLWMATELMSFGTLSRAFAHLVPEAQKLIVRGVGVHELVLKNWLHTAAYLRNLCAHHARLWNRELAIRPEIPAKDKTWQDLRLDNTRIFAIFVILVFLRRAFALREPPIARVQAVLEDLHRAFPFAARSMGVPGALREIWLEDPAGWLGAFQTGGHS